MHLETLTFQRFFGIVRQRNKEGDIVYVDFGFEAGEHKVYSAKVAGNPTLRDGATLTVAMPRAGAWREIVGWLDHSNGQLHQGDPDRDWHWVGGGIALTALMLGLANAATSTAGRYFAIFFTVMGLVMMTGIGQRLLWHSRAQRLLVAKRDELRSAGQLEPGTGHRPNLIPAGERRKNVLFSLALFAYGVLAWRMNDVFIPGKRGPGLHFHDAAAKFMVGAFACACVVMLSVVIDHYDRRANERHYRRFANAFCVLAYLCVGVAMFLNVGGRP